MSLSREKKDILLLYNQKVEKLLKHSLLQGKTSLEISLTPPIVPPSFKIGDASPTEEQIESLLVRFRPFYLEKESTNFLKVCNLLWKLIDNEDQKSRLKQLRERYKTIMKSGGGFNLRVNDSTVKPKDNLDKWLNAYYFHSDREKEEKLKQLQNSTKGFAKVFFLKEIISLIEVIKDLNVIVQEVLSES